MVNRSQFLLMVAVIFVGLACTQKSTLLNGSDTSSSSSSAPTPLPTATPPPTGTPPLITGGIKWHPGHYIWLDPNASQSSRDSVITSLSNEPNIQGFQIILSWAAMEGPTQGDFSKGFAAIDHYLSLFATLKTPKHLLVGLQGMWYGASPPSTCNGLPLPSYLLTSAFNGGCALSHQGAAGSTIGSALVWQQPTMDALINLSVAYGKRYDGNPNFEMFYAGVGETAMAVTGFDTGGYITQMKRWIDASHSAWPHTQIRLVANYLGSDAQMDDLINYYASKGGVAVGGPDPDLSLTPIANNYPVSKCTSSSGFTIGGWDPEVEYEGSLATSSAPTLLSLSASNATMANSLCSITGGNSSCFSKATTSQAMCVTRAIQADELFRGARSEANDLRGTAPWVAEVQQLGLSTDSRQTVPARIFDFQYNTMHASYFIWLDNSWTGSAAQFFNTGILPFIQSIGGKTHSECPSNYNGQCNTK